MNGIRTVVTVALLLVLLTVGSPGPTPRSQEPAVPASDDAYHFALWADGSHDASYTEWWYFNVFDARHGVQAIFSYFVTNPGDLFGGAHVQMVAVAYTRDGIVTEVDPYPLEAFAASYEWVDVTIGANTVRAIDGETYRVTGASRDGRLAWDLTYASRAAPWFAADRMTVGSLAWEQMSWLVAMPRAAVSGQLSVDGRAYTIRASGYHDHNWGEWFPTDVLWNWAQYSNRRLTVEMGDFIGKPAGMVRVDLDGERTVFSKEQYALTHTRWAWDRVNGGFYPIASTLVAENEAHRLEIDLRALDTAPLRGDLPAPFRDLLIYEQTARYEGRLLTRDSSGAWVVALQFVGRGFKEYTTKRY